MNTKPSSGSSNFHFFLRTMIVVTDKPFSKNGICSFTGFEDGIVGRTCASPNGNVGFEEPVWKQWNDVPCEG